MKRFKAIRITGYVLIAAGLLLISVSLFINIKQQIMKEAVMTAFKEEMMHNAVFYKEIPIDTQEDDGEAVSTAETPEEAAEAPVKGDMLCILRIPSIDSENPVREGVSAGVLADSLGHEPETAMMGETGNCVIAGHRNYTFGSFFNRLNEVVEGDMIYIDTASDTFSYKVREIKVVEPEDLSVLENTDEEILTLYTCTPIYVATHRLVIVAERVY